MPAHCVNPKHSLPITIHILLWDGSQKTWKARVGADRSGEWRETHWGGEKGQEGRGEGWGDSGSGVGATERSGNGWEKTRSWSDERSSFNYHHLAHNTKSVSLSWIAEQLSLIHWWSMYGNHYEMSLKWRALAMWGFSTHLCHIDCCLCPFKLQIVSKWVCTQTCNPLTSTTLLQPTHADYSSIGRSSSIFYPERMHDVS